MPRKHQLETSEKRKAPSSARWLGFGVFLLALLVRGIYLYESRDNPTFFTPIVDAQTYDGLARRLAGGQAVTSEFFWQPIFYPLFLSLVYRLSHSSILWAKIIQAVLGALTSSLTYHLGRRIFGRRTAIIAAAIAALYLPSVFYETELLAAGWAAFWLVAILLLLIRIKEKPGFWNCFALGAAGMLSIITRTEFLPFLGAACLWLFIVWVRGQIGAAKIIRGTASICLGFLVIAGPLGILNHRVTGRARILPYSGGINFYIGNNPNYKKTITVRPGLGWRELTATPARYGITDDQGMERFFFNKTKEYIISEKAGFIKGLAYKTLQFISGREIPRNTDIYTFRKWSRLLQLLVWKIGHFGFPFGVLLPLALVGLIFCRRSLPGPILLSLFLYPASMIVVFVTSRYRAPVVPVISILAAAGVGIMGKMGQKKQWKSLAAAWAIVASACAISSAPGFFYEERLDYEAELYYGLGSTYDAWGKEEEARKAYLKAIDLRADYAEAHYNLANILKSQGQIEESIGHYAQALQTEPNSIEIRNNFGAALKMQGLISQAIQQWEKALEIIPSDPYAHFNMGLAMAEQGKYDLSIKHFKEALQKSPDWVDIHINLGMIFLQQGKAAEAIEQFNEALRIKPDDAAIHCSLGVALGSQGELVKAIGHFREAIRLEPGHIEAHYNLGYALQLQGKLDEAIAEYQRLLQIDPHHTLGRQNLERALAQSRQER